MNNLEKEFVPYQEALALKELGFTEPCFTWYWDDMGLYNGFGYGNYNKNPNLISAPTYSQAFRWFLEKQFKMSYIYYDVEYEFCFCIGYNNKIKGFKTYKEAELACLKKLIEIVENGK